MSERRRKIAMLVLGPFLADFPAGLFMFWMNVSAVRMGVPPRFQALIGGLFAAGYAVSAHAAGRWSTPARARRQMAGALVLATVFGSASLYVSSFPVMVGCATVLGVLMGQYFVPFQVKMKNVQPFRTLAWTIAFYDVSWGCSFTLSPYIAGTFRGAGPAWPVAVAWCALAVHLALILSLPRADRNGGEAGHPAAAFRSTAAQRRMGWIGGGVASLVLSGLCATIWPGLGSMRGLSDQQIGIGIAAMGAQVAAWSLLWARLSPRLVRPGLFLCLLGLAAASVLAVPFVRGWPAVALPLGVFGFAFTGIVYHAIYYSNADPDNVARSVGLNEALLGACSIAGPILLGALAWDRADSLRPYVASAGLLGGCIVPIVLMLRREDGLARRRSADLDSTGGVCDVSRG